jgi:hypothetical protein
MGEQVQWPWQRCFLCNFIPDRGQLHQDGNLITSKTAAIPQQQRTYDMAQRGEWTSTIYTEAGVVPNDLTRNTSIMRRRRPLQTEKKMCAVARGKTPRAYPFAWRTWEYQNQPRSYIASGACAL